MIEDLPPRRTTPYIRKKPAKVKIEFSDNSGAKYAFSVEGMSKENMVKLMEFVDSISGGSGANDQEPLEPMTTDTNFARVYELIEAKFTFGSFTSTDVLEAYEDHFQLPTTLSTISTYLARLADRCLLTRARNGSGWIYKLARVEEDRGRLMLDQADRQRLIPR